MGVASIFSVFYDICEVLLHFVVNLQQN